MRPLVNVPSVLARHPRFEVRRPLGAGGMGIVYEAFDRETQAIVALKTTLRASPATLLLFKNEFRALVDLHHPNLIRLHELHCEDGTWFFTMELLRDAADLRAWVRLTPLAIEQTAGPSAVVLTTLSDGARETSEPSRPAAGARCSEERLRPALAQLAIGLAALHGARRVHRDIKPSNVLVTPEGRVVLLDFGLVIAEGDAMSRSDAGTPLYMAPEQAAGGSVGPPADWYAVGVLLYECLTGAPPFNGSAAAILASKLGRDPTPVRALVPAAPADLCDLCDDLLARDPAERPTSEQVLVRLGVGPSGAPPARPRAASFVGRAREIEALDEAFEHSRRGAVSVFLQGESGLGKSALVRRFLDVLDARPSVAILTGRCFDREQVPFKAFDGVIDALARKVLAHDPALAARLRGDDARLLARMFPVLAGEAPPLSEAPASVDPVEQRARAFAAMRGLFARLAEARDVVVFVDDLQWADADGLALLRELLRPPDAPRLLFVAAMRDAPEVDRWLADLQGDVRRLTLRPLSIDESAELARTLVGAGERDAEAIARASAGHPLFLQELARHAGSLDHASPAAWLDAALWARVARLPAAARDVLSVVAVAGSPLAHRQVGDAVGLAPEAYAAITGALRAESLVQTRGVRPDDVIEAYHARVSEAVLAHLDGEALRHSHRALVSAFDRAGIGDHRPELLVRHLEGAGEEARAAMFALRAAENAEAGMAFDQAAHFYRIARRLGRPPEAEAQRIELRLADVLASSGRGPDSADVLLGVAARTSGGLRLDSQRKAVEHLLGSGHFQRGFSILRSICDDLGVPFPETRGRAMASAVWQRVKIRARGFRFTERDERDVPVEDLRRLDVYTAIGVGLSQVGLVRGEDFHARGLLLALQVGEPRRLARYFLYEAMFRSNGEQFSLAARLMDVGSRIAAELDDPYLLGLAAGARGVVALSRSCHLEAADGIAEGERIWRSHGLAAWELHVTVVLLLQTTLPLLGRVAEERPRVEAYHREAEQRGDRLMETILRTSSGYLWLARDDPDGIERALDTIPWRLADIIDKGVSRFESWWEVFETWSRVEIALYRGDRARLAALGRDLAEASGSLLGGLPMVRARGVSLVGRVALALGRRSEAHKAARTLDRQGTRHADLLASLLRAELASADGDRGGARALLEGAQVLADSLGMRLVSATARRRRGELLGGDAGRALVGEADVWMRAQGIVRPDRMASVIAPGLRTRS
ncbi:MAG: AAA family ATPase [Polyangiaceae bacterium]